MKLLFTSFIFCITFFSFSQNNYIVNPENGRRVLLKPDFTWEYIDAQQEESIKLNTLNKKNTCNLDSNFKEPKLNSKIQAKLKRGRATMLHVKKKVAKDYKCSPNDVILLNLKEQKEKAVYYFCVQGKKTTYKRIGNSIIKAAKLF